MEHYIVTGMNCVVCSGRVEKVVSELDGVENCNVSLLTNSMTVEGTASSKAIIRAVKAAGYGAKLVEEDEISNKGEIIKLRNRLLYSIGFMMVLMYISMGYMMFDLPLPAFMDENYMMIAIAQGILSLIVILINRVFFVKGISALFNKAPNMDTLVALGSGASYIYSLYGMILIQNAYINANITKVHHYAHDLYFESAAMILVLITVGKLLEAISKGKTTSAINGLMQLSPKVATIIRNDVEIEVSIDEVKVDDVFVLKPGERVPVDGVVISGSSSINEAALTGESVPVDVDKGDKIMAATTNINGYLHARATRVGQDTTLAQIIKMVSEASATKAPIAKIADKVSGVFVPVVMSIAFITFVVWMLFGKDLGFSLERSISVLVISCPCALGLATPVAIMVGNGVAARRGILFKNAVALEQTGKVNTILLDKTGTITKGEPEVTDVYNANNVSREELLRCAYSLERKSEHPLAKAIVSFVEKEDIKAFDVENFVISPGNGLSGFSNGDRISGGKLEFINTYVKGLDEQGGINKYIKNDDLKDDIVSKLAMDGKTILYFSKNDKFLGFIAVADVIKEDSKEAICDLKNMGIDVVMVTGDQQQTAIAIGDKVGVNQVKAGVLPAGKEELVREFKKKGHVIMVGDGINDAPALTSADVGIAIGAGADIAIDAADVVVVKSKLSDVVTAIKLSRKTLKNIHQNLFWAFFYNCLGIPLAAGVYISLLGWEMNPMFGAFAMSLSSFCVVSNALRLNLYRE